MVTFRDPITDTTWFSSNRPVGSLASSFWKVLGIGFLFIAITIGSTVIAPMVGGLISGLSGGRVQAGGAGSIPTRRAES